MGEAALVLAPFSPGALETLGHSLSVTYESWTDTRKLYSPEELSQRINEEGIYILIVEADFVFEEMFGESPPLKFLGVCRNSLDHIDVQAATEHGVVVVNAPGRNAQAVAELTIGLMLCLSRGIPKLNCYVRNGKWQGPVEPYLSMRGVELGGKTLGILGLGSIGKKVAGIGRAMGMQVLAYDPYARTPGARKAGALLGDLEQVAKLSDFLSIHTPDTAETQGLVGRRILEMMKPGSYIVNTAAYAAIEEDALVEHLQSGHIAGVGLDVHRTHPIPPSCPLLGMENAIFTPHIGGATDGTVERQSWMMVDDIHRFLSGRRPKHLVNGAVWRRRG